METSGPQQTRSGRIPRPPSAEETQNMVDQFHQVMGGRESSEMFFLPVARYVREAYFLKLLSCLTVDTIGFATFIVPVLGEVVDIAWAPASGMYLYYMFGSSSRIAALGFLEELLPGTDFIPSATIAWILENVESRGLDSFRSMAGIKKRSEQRNE